jgi:hypothetical protein
MQIWTVAAHVHTVDVVNCLRETLQLNVQLVTEASRSIDDEVNGCSVAQSTRSTIATVLIRLRMS